MNWLMAAACSAALCAVGGVVLKVHTVPALQVVACWGGGVAAVGAAGGAGNAVLKSACLSS